MKLSLEYFPRDEDHDDFLITPALKFGGAKGNGMWVGAIALQWGYWAVGICLKNNIFSKLEKQYEEGKIK